MSTLKRLIAASMVAAVVLLSGLGVGSANAEPLLPDTTVTSAPAAPADPVVEEEVTESSVAPAQPAPVPSTIPYVEPPASSTPVPAPETPETTASLPPETSTPAPAPETTATVPPTTTVTASPTTSPEAQVTESATSTESQSVTTTGSTTTKQPADATSEAATDSSTPSSATDSSEVSAGESSAASTTPAVATTSSLIQQAIAQATPEVQRAAAADVALAKNAVPIEKNPGPAPTSEVEDLRNEVFGKGRPNGQGSSSLPPAPNLPGDHYQRPPRQWNPDWVWYDRNYRPIISNPYRETLKIVYVYEGAPRVVIVPPLASVTVEVRQVGAYNFTAVRVGVNVGGVSVNVDVSVGAFFGGGYVPAPGHPPPPPPPAVVPCTQVIVVVKYTKVVYEPIKVRRVIKVGYDDRYRADKVLLDGVTPAWGVWKQQPERRPDGQLVGGQFEMHKTQQFPGLEEPKEVTPPGDYQLRLANDTDNGPTWENIAVGALSGIGVLAFGWIGMMLWRRLRPTRPAH